MYALNDAVDCNQPVVLARVASRERGFAVVLDGYHRIYKAWMTGKTDLPCFVLSEREEGQFRTACSIPLPLLAPSRKPRS